MYRAFRVLVVLPVLFLFSIVAVSQTTPSSENGFKPYGSYDGSAIDSVNLMNGNVMLHAPLLPSYPQRGSLKPQDILYLTSLNWTVKCAPGCFWVYGGTGVIDQNPLYIGVSRTLETDAGSGVQQTSYAYNYALTMPDGQTSLLYPIPSSLTSGQYLSFESIDTSGYRVDVSNLDQYGAPQSGSVTDRHGNRYNISKFTGACHTTISPDGTSTTLCSQNATIDTVTDPNGNVYTLGSVAGLDTLGRTPPFTTGTTTTDYSGCITSNGPIARASTYNYSAPDGTTKQVKWCYATVQLQTSFNQSGVQEVQNSNGQSPTSIQEVATIILADGNKWTFAYDSYGDVTSIGLPTGGSIAYTWTTVSLDNCNRFSKLSRAVATRTTSANVYPWQYT